MIFGRFETVSLNEYSKARQKMNGCADMSAGRIYQEYNSIVLPKRATMLSAGYDISVPYDVTEDLVNDGMLKLPTGLRWISTTAVDPAGMPIIPLCELYVRSSTGTKKGWVLANGTGIIDADYFMSDNEGHIYICLTRNNIEKCGWFECNEPIVQGIFKQVHTVLENDVTTIRNGGFGSTSFGR